MEKVKEKMAQLKKDGIDFNVGIDPDHSIFDLYCKVGVPQSFVIDKKGVIRYISIGYNEDKLNNISSMIKKMLDE
jgi:peroxiredoxin